MNFYPDIDCPYHDVDVKTNRFVPTIKSFETEMDNSVIKELANSSVPDPSISVLLTPHPEVETSKSLKTNTTKSSVSIPKL